MSFMSESRLIERRFKGGLRERALRLALVLVLGAIGCSPEHQPDEVAPSDASPAEDGDVAETVEEAPRAKGWAYVEAGSFQIGSPPLESGRAEIETRHNVTLTNGYLIQPTEVTQEEFVEVMGYNPSRFAKCGPTCPVEDLSWHEATAYCNRISSLEDLRSCYACTGKGRSVRCQRNGAFDSIYRCPGYRLPSEAEWEHAARGGEMGSTPRGSLELTQLGCESPHPILDPVAWFCGNSEGRTHPVGQKEPNSRGLYDILGNVWEWSHDWDRPYTTESVTDPWGPSVGKSRVGRGGSWANKGKLVRFAARGGGTPDKGYGFTGFRVVRSCLPPDTNSLCRHQYASRWANNTDESPPQPVAEPDAGNGDEGGESESTSGGEESSVRDTTTRSNTLILTLVVVGVIALFGLERLIRRLRRKRSGRRKDAE